jgi:hypothetical protein
MVGFLAGAADLPLLQSIQTNLGTHPAACLMVVGGVGGGGGVSFHGVKWVRCEADHTPHLAPGLRKS